MRRPPSRTALAVLILALSMSSGAFAAAVASDTAAPILPLSEIRIGQHGYGLSVWQGSTPERFEAEVLGVMRNTSPETSYIVARLSGKDLEKSGVIAGMSGSPVYIDGKLVGAVAFSFLFAQDAIAGITPIEAMRSLGRFPTGERTIPPSMPAAKSTDGAATTLAAQLREQLLTITNPATSASRLQEQLALLRAPASPLASGTASGLLFAGAGFGESSQSILRQALGGLAAAGEPSPTKEANADLVPGGAVAGILVDGDLRLAVTGTVTDRIGDQILAFGHPFLGSGPMRLPMAPAEVVTIVSSRINSFKIANFGSPIGAFDQDRSVGVRGRIGLAAPMVPLSIKVKERTFHMRLADVPALLPQMLAVSTLGSIDASGHANGPLNLNLEARFKLRHYGELRLAQTFDGDGAGVESALYLLAVGAFLTQNRLADVEIENVEVTLQVRDGIHSAMLLAAHADHAVVRPGDRVGIDLDLQAYRDGPFRHALAVTVPSDLPNGRYSLLIGDGASVDAARLAFENASPETFEQVLALLATLHSRRDLVVLGFSAAKGLEVAGQAMPRLPGSMRAVWGAAGSWSASPLRFAVAQQEVETLDVPVLGAVRVDLDVRRREPLDAAGRPVQARPAATTPKPGANPRSVSQGDRP
ncbi:MAG: SpoIVB peptidase S55 domain-containing protein [Acidobacteriota bacterium]